MAPLTAGVGDIDWRALSSFGLQHSRTIFEAKTWGSGQTTQVILNKEQSHHRAWQEDNEVANVHGSGKVETIVEETMPDI